VHIGAKSNNTWDLVVDAPRLLPEPTACCAAYDIDPTEPDKGDVIRHGEKYGKQRAQKRLINNAQDAASQDVPGLTPYYDSVLIRKGLGSRFEICRFAIEFEVIRSPVIKDVSTDYI